MTSGVPVFCFRNPFFTREYNLLVLQRFPRFIVRKKDSLDNIRAGLRSLYQEFDVNLKFLQNAKNCTRMQTFL